MNLSPELIKQMVEDKLDFVRRCGLKFTECRKGFVQCEMPTLGNENHLGTMYAGALFTLAEIPGGALWASSFDTTRSYPILKAFNIEYLRPARGTIRFSLEMNEADIAEIVSSCEQKGKADFVIEGDLLDEEGLVVARSRGNYQLRLNSLKS